MSMTANRKLADENSSAGPAEQDTGHAAISLRWVVTRKCMFAAIATTVGKGL